VYYIRNLVDPALDRSRISRFRRSASNPDIADPASEVVLMEFAQPFPNHNGGDLHFGPDGFLYIASGDGGSGGDPLNNGQRVGTLLGKLLRIDVNGVPAAANGPDCGISPNRNYRIPVGNAFSDGKGGQGCDEIYALGLRNPWRFSFDRLTGGLWIADVGQVRVEEIDFIPASSSGGLNLGWRCYEGNLAFNTTGCNKAYLFPVYTYSHSVNGNCSVTGGYVYRGAAFPALAGKYFFTDFCNSAIRTLSGPLSAPTVVNVLPQGQVTTPSTFGENAAGELYVASLNGGIVYRIIKP
jgi:glucose/arabinose dehydrogenase